MKTTSLLSLLLLAGISVCGLPGSEAALKPQSGNSGKQPEIYHLRGFGKVGVRSQFFGEGEKRSSWITFAAQDAVHAGIIASKYRADLLGFGDLKLRENPAIPGTVIGLDGAGLWLIGRDGTDCHVLFASTAEKLKELAGKAGANRWKPAEERAYPRWMDGFDNAGTAIWYGGGGAPVDIPADFQWMKERGFTFCSQPPKESRYVAPGVMDSSFTDWFSAMCKRYDIPYRTLLWSHSPEWAWNREPLPYAEPARGLLPEPDIRIHEVFEPMVKSDLYTHDFRRRFTEDLHTDPNLLGYHALPEVPAAGVMELGPVAGMAETKSAWHEYLKDVLKFNLKEAGQRYKGSREAYRSWEQVEVPVAADFMGFDADTVQLAGEWEGLADSKKEGIAAKWFASMPSEGWVKVKSNDPMLLMYGGGAAPELREKRGDYWLRRNVSVKEAQISRLKYLNVQRAMWHGPSYGTFCEAYLNGKALKAVTRDSQGELTACFEVGDALRPGDNQLVLCAHGSPPAGFIAMGAKPLRSYPHLDERENRLWFDTTNFSAWLRMRNAENILKAMRAGDPDRPLKVMATINLLDMSQPLCIRYGAYQHDTGGAGGYWAPMTGARLARAHGMPWSCEQGGPPKSVLDMEAAMTFYLLYGNDAVDLVFATTHYKDNLAVAKWVDANLAKMHCIGKLDLPPQKIAILRSSRVTRMGFHEPWDWDLGRGALQGIGRNFVYVEVPDLSTGLADNYPVIIDDGTVLLTEEDVAAIRRYVEQGGIFVAQHDTGRHLPARADAWPLAAAFGLKVEPRLINSENYNNWPLSRITFTKEQALIPSLRGKECKGSGVAIDYLNRISTGAVGLSGSGEEIRPVALWDDGAMAVAEVHRGKGRLVYLGTPFYARMKDSNGLWVNEDGRQALLDEMLSGLGVERESWTGNRDVWAEHWTSKNGVYDLYPVARLVKNGQKDVAATVSLLRDAPVSEVVEVSANGHPKIPVTWKDGRFTLPEISLGKMELRLYAAHRPDAERAALHWFDIQRQLWRGLPPLSPEARPKVVPLAEDIIPAAEGWRMATGESGEEWTEPGFADETWKTVKLGTFAALGIPEEATAQFRREIILPDSWKDRLVSLVFDAEWSYGISHGKLWINGKPAAIPQPLRAYGASNFSLDVTQQAKDGKVLLALEVDGTQPSPGSASPHSRPVGTTGIFYLHGVAPSVSETPLTGPWLAATDVNVFTAAKIGKPADFNYLETRFTLPKDWPGQRVFLESTGPLGWIVVNDQVIQTPKWMKSLDISRLVKRGGENVLRYAPDAPNFLTRYTRPVPELRLAWKK